MDLLSSSRGLFLIASLLLVFNSEWSFAQCTANSGQIDSGNNVGSGLSGVNFLDPNGDGYITSTGTYFSDTLNEINEFEALDTDFSGCSSEGGTGGCAKTWTPIGVTEPQADLSSGGNCGNTDIINDGNNGNTFAYYCIVDDDAICNNGNEYMVFRIRNANNISGAFSFSFLIDTDGQLGTNDVDGIVCGSKTANSGFEREVHLQTKNNGGIFVYDIDGVIGTSNANGCGGAGNVAGDPCYTYSNKTYGNVSYACAGDCGHRASGGDPIFLTYYVPLADLGIDCTTSFSMVPASSSSGNSILVSDNSVSDMGGTGELVVANNDCGCGDHCQGPSPTCSTLSVCMAACLLECSGSSNSVALPVELIRFDARPNENGVLLEWATATEINNSHFIIENSTDGVNFRGINVVKGAGNSIEIQNYSFLHRNPEPIVNYYRLKQVDFDGTYAFSPVRVAALGNSKHFEVVPNIASDYVRLNFFGAGKDAISLTIIDLEGRVIRTEMLLKGTESFDLNISSLHSGYYLALAKMGSTIKTKRFIKTYSTR